MKDDNQSANLRALIDAGIRSFKMRSTSRRRRTDTARAEAGLREHAGKFGNMIFEPIEVGLDVAQSWFVPASALNALCREAVEALEAAQAAAYVRPVPGRAVAPPVPHPEDTLSHLSNVYNHKAHNFYAKHGSTSSRRPTRATRNSARSA